jgi:hypothetical protein
MLSDFFFEVCEMKKTVSITATRLFYSNLKNENMYMICGAAYWLRMSMNVLTLLLR